MIRVHMTVERAVSHLGWLLAVYQLRILGCLEVAQNVIGSLKVAGPRVLHKVCTQLELMAIAISGSVPHAMHMSNPRSSC